MEADSISLESVRHRQLGIALTSDGPHLSTGVPVIDGDGVDGVFGPAEPAGTAGPFELFTARGWLLGRAAVSSGPRPEEAARAAYGALLSASRGWRLARIWNYIPDINQSGTGGLENYRAFSAGRSEAFESEFGPSFRQLVPAASAVGTDGEWLVIHFAAVRGAVQHVENPWQIPAYDYPPEHGVRAPSFARATVVPADAQKAAVFVSGTSSIVGHATISPSATLPQLSCTLENLDRISQACGLGQNLSRVRAQTRNFRVYLRDEADLPAVKDRLERDLLAPGDQVKYLRAAICRRELNIEIEATLLGAERTR